MSPILVAGVVIVNLALVSYAVGIVSEQRSRLVSRTTLNWLRLGVVLDVTATVCMIAGSSHGPFTAHGLLGFSSLAAMVTETALAWRHHTTRGATAPVPGWLHGYSRVAFGWWLVAYLTGAYLVRTAS